MKHFLEGNTFEGFSTCGDTFKLYSHPKENLCPLSDDFVSDFSEEEVSLDYKSLFKENKNSDGEISDASFTGFQNLNHSDILENSDAETNLSFIGFENSNNLNASVTDDKTHHGANKKITSEYCEGIENKNPWVLKFREICSTSDDSDDSFEGFENIVKSSTNKDPHATAVNGSAHHHKRKILKKKRTIQVTNGRRSGSVSDSSIEAATDGYSDAAEAANNCDASQFLTCNISEKGSKNINSDCIKSRELQLKSDVRVRLTPLTDKTLTDTYCDNNGIGKNCATAIRTQLQNLGIHSTKRLKESTRKASSVNVFKSKQTAEIKEKEPENTFYPLDPFEHSIFAPIIKKDRLKNTVISSPLYGSRRVAPYISGVKYVQVNKSHVVRPFVMVNNSFGTNQRHSITQGESIPPLNQLQTPQNSSSNNKCTVYFPKMVPGTVVQMPSNNGGSNVRYVVNPTLNENVVTNQSQYAYPTLSSTNLSHNIPTNKILYRLYNPINSFAQKGFDGRTESVAVSESSPNCNSQTFNPNQPSLTNPRQNFISLPVKNSSYPRVGIQNVSEQGINVLTW